MKTIFALLVVLVALACVAQASRSNPCQDAQRPQSNPERYCGNNGNIYPNRAAFDCAKTTNSRLRRISCNDSLILAKNALGTIREQHRTGEVLTQREKIQKMRQRHEQQQREREQQSQQRRQ